MGSPVALAMSYPFKLRVEGVMLVNTTPANSLSFSLINTTLPCRPMTFWPAWLPWHFTLAFGLHEFFASVTLPEAVALSGFLLMFRYHMFIHHRFV